MKTIAENYADDLLRPDAHGEANGRGLLLAQAGDDLRSRYADLASGDPPSRLLDLAYDVAEAIDAARRDAQDAA